MDVPEHGVVVSGVGKTKVGRRLPTSAMELALGSISAAVHDAGLSMTDVDGLATFPGPVKESYPGFVGPDLWEVQDALRIQANWSLTTFLGAGPPAPLQAAILAVAAGLCRHAVVYRTLTESSGQGTGRRPGAFGGEVSVDAPYDFLSAVGAVSVPNWIALYAQRFMHEYGVTREQLGWISVINRRHASRNENAVLREPLSLQEYLDSRQISSPLCLYDCDIPVDASIAIVVSAAETAPDLRAPVAIEAMAGATPRRPHWEQFEDVQTTAAYLSGSQLWSRTDLEPSEVDVVQMYDGFSILALAGLEAFGFCGRGEAGAFVEGGERIDLGGALPMNTYGGQLSAGRLHGYGALVEAVAQVRHEAGTCQVRDAEIGFAGGGGGGMGFGFLFSRYR